MCVCGFVCFACETINEFNLNCYNFFREGNLLTTLCRFSLSGFDQVPQLTSSRLIDVNTPIKIINEDYGTRRAVMIGINYIGTFNQECSKYFHALYVFK